MCFFYRIIWYLDFSFVNHFFGFLMNTEHRCFRRPPVDKETNKIFSLESLRPLVNHFIRGLFFLDSSAHGKKIIFLPDNV